jgi:CRP/FNR family cyclic AMP-dependent transcriptional regulator
MVSFLWENLFRFSPREHFVKSAVKENVLFRNLSMRELSFIESVIHERHYRAGEIIFQQGEVGVGMYIVAKGTVEVSVREKISAEDESKEIHVTRLEAGDFFGELALVDEDGRRSATARASEDCILMGFFKPDLLAVLERNPSLGVKVVFRLAEVLGRRLKDTTERISQLKMELRGMSDSESRKNYSP